MADRTILKYTEERLPEGPYWTLEVERSASGRPDVFVTIRHTPYADARSQTEKTVVVKDADKVFGPIVEWAEQRRAGNY